jgi:uncharacterized protein (TIGR00255 family)
VVSVSLRSVNNRSFKLTTRLPEFLQGAQRQLEELLRDTIARGTVYCQVEIEGPPAQHMVFDEKALASYCRKLRSAAKKAGVPSDIRIEQVAALPGVLREDRAAGAQLQALLVKAAAKALRSLIASRRSEGTKIEKELRGLLKRVVGLCARVEKARRGFLRRSGKRLADRINDLFSRAGVKIKPADVAREAAIMAERSDVAEELQRLGMHTQQMDKVLSGRKPAGRQLEFISQEMLREANTMSAKSVSSKLVVPLLELKGAVDRIREQAQNVQ